MAQFNGKWKLVSTENAEAFADKVKATDQFKSFAHALLAESKTNPDVYIEELKVDVAANTAQRILYARGEVSKDSGANKFGVEIDGRCYGKPAKMRSVLESPTKMVRHEKGEDFEATTTLEVQGDNLIITQVSGGVKAVDKFHRA